MFADLVGFSMLIPDIQIRADRLGAPGWLIGLLLSSMFIVQSVASPIWGRLGDRVGRKRVLLGCTLLSTISMILYSQATSLWVILGSRVLAGLGAANVATAQALASASVEKDRRVAEMGRIGAAISAGLVIGPAIGGYLAMVGGPLLVGLVAASLSLSGLVAAAFLVQDQPAAAQDQQGGEARLRFAGTVAVLMSIAAVSWFSLATLEGTFGRLLVHVYGRGQDVFGYIFAYESLIAVCLQAWVVGAVVRRLGERRVLTFSYLLQGLGLAATPFAGTLPLLLVASTVYAVGGAMANPTLNGWVGAITPERDHGAVYGWLQSARSLGFAVGPTLGGALFDWRMSAPYVLAGATCAVAAAAAALLRARKDPKEDSRS